MENLYTKKEDRSGIVSKEVEDIFGRGIRSSRDCILLSEEIFNKTAFKINANTLRRFFGLVKADYPPSESTLNILSRYCGFESFDELLASSKSRKNGGEDQNAAGILNYLISIFRFIPTKDYYDETFLALVKHTIQFLNRHPELSDKFQKAIAKTKNGQEFYFEQFINIDGLNSFYGEGLRYYLLEKKTTEAQIFGHSLLCLRGWLSDKVSEVKQHYEAVMEQRLDNSIHPFVCGRYFATQLYYTNINILESERILADARIVHATLKQGRDNYRLFPAFEYVFSSALLVTGHYNEALYYINYALKNYPEKPSYIEDGFYIDIDLIKALVLVKNGRKEEAEKIYNQIKPSEFYFLTRKINMIMYLFLRKFLKKINGKMDQQLKDLIKATGFIKLLTINGNHDR
jgi:hypothetical protein